MRSKYEATILIFKNKLYLSQGTMDTIDYKANKNYFLDIIRK